MIEKKKKLWQIIAVCVSFLLFIFLLYIDQTAGKVDYIDELKKQNILIRQAFDKQLESLVQSLPDLTKAITPLKECSKSAIDKLGQYAFTHPQLSTIAVKSNYLANWCISPEFRTLPQYKLKGHQKQLTGPVIDPNSKKSFFVLQYPGNENIVYHLYILKSVFESAINTQSPLIDNILIVNQDGQALLQNKPTADRVLDSMSIKSVASSDILPNIKILVDANEAHLQSGNSKKLWSLQLLSIAIAALFLLSLLLHINRSFSINGLIKKGIRNFEFYPVFQPVFDAKTHHISGVEILIRWQDSFGSHIMPSQFIEDAEHSGQIVPITDQLIEMAFQQLRDYIKENRSFHLGINLSRAHFADANWLTTLQKLCQQYDVEPSQLLLEVTERTMIDSTEINLADHMHAMHNAGFRLAIDDFGTSHASISYLRHFPLDYLKIDMMYVHAIGTGAVTEALLPPIILIANQLKLKIIAEGVETEAQLNYLKEQKVDYIQGWYFAKAMDAKTLIETYNQMNE